MWAAARAVELDGTDPLGYAMRGMGVFLGGQLDRYPDALADVRRAHEMNPNDTFVLLMLGTVEAGVGEHESAIEHGQQMLRLNPRQSYSHMTYNLLAFASFGAKQYTEGIGWALRALNDTPRLLFAHLHLATCLIGTGEIDKARAAFAAGAARVSIDFTEGRLATRNDPRNPWTGRNMLPHFIELDNRVLARFTPEERRSIGVHTCPGGDRDSVHSADVDYNDLLPSMFGLNAGYFLIQLASERDKDRVYRIIGENLREDADGVTQMAYTGVINPLNPRVESPEEVRDALVRAANFIPAEQLGSTDDCGFSPFSIDEKPNHGSPDYARDVAFQKITNRVAGTRMAAEKLGIS